MMAHLPQPPDTATLAQLVRIARLLLDHWPAERPVPPNLEKPLQTFYDLTNYHGLAPADAPHISEDGI